MWGPHRPHVRVQRNPAIQLRRVLRDARHRLSALLTRRRPDPLPDHVVEGMVALDQPLHPEVQEMLERVVRESRK